MWCWGRWEKGKKDTRSRAEWRRGMMEARDEETGLVRAEEVVNWGTRTSGGAHLPGLRRSGS